MSAPISCSCGLQSGIGIENILEYLIALYAIAPSVIITLMYSFLSQIDLEGAKLTARQKESEEGKTVSDQEKMSIVNLRNFTVISAKVLHVVMTFYLLLLLGALLSKTFSVAMSGPRLTSIFLFWVTAACLVYAGWYLPHEYCALNRDDKHGNDIDAKTYWWAAGFYGLLLVLTLVPYAASGYGRGGDVLGSWPTVLRMLFWLLLGTLSLVACYCYCGEDRLFKRLGKRKEDNKEDRKGGCQANRASVKRQQQLVAKLFKAALFWLSATRILIGLIVVLVVLRISYLGWLDGLARVWPEDEAQLHMLWISMSVLLILGWWLVFPFKYKPLSEVAKLEMSIADQRHTGNHQIRKLIEQVQKLCEVLNNSRGREG